MHPTLLDVSHFYEDVTRFVDDSIYVFWFKVLSDCIDVV